MADVLSAAVQTVGGGHTSPGLKHAQSLTKDSTFGSVNSCPVDTAASAPGEMHGAANGGTYVPGTVREGEPLATKDKFAANGAPVMRRSSPGGSAKPRRSGLFACCSSPAVVLEDDNSGPCVADGSGSGPGAAAAPDGSEHSAPPGLMARNGSVGGFEGSNKSASIVRLPALLALPPATHRWPGSASQHGALPRSTLSDTNECASTFKKVM